MKVVFATPYPPAPPHFGGARRMFELIRGARQAHDVSVLSLAGSGDDVASAVAHTGSITPVRVPFTAQTVVTRLRRASQLRSIVSTKSFQHRLYHHSTFQTALDRHVGQYGAELVQFEFSQMGCYRMAEGIPTVLDVHNVEHDLLRQMTATGSITRRLFYAVEYRKFRSEEIASWRNATCCIATSDVDASLVAQHTGVSVPVIPNGVDLEFFQFSPESHATPGSIVFVGAMRYRPNAEAVKFFVEQVFPTVRRAIPDARFTVVGADPLPEVIALADSTGVSVTGKVPDVRPWLEAAELVVAPLLTGGGTRLKILEAFAVGRPVIATTVGAKGIDVESRKHLLLADDPAEFAACVVELSKDDELRSRLTANGLELVRKRYQWTAIARTLNDLHAELAERRSTDW